MESQKQSRDESYRDQPTGSSFEAQLKDVILNHLNLLSEEGKEKVLDFINALIDLEQKKLEFNRRQGRLYNWSDTPHLECIIRTSPPRARSLLIPAPLKIKRFTSLPRKSFVSHPRVLDQKASCLRRRPCSYIMEMKLDP